MARGMMDKPAAAESGGAVRVGAGSRRWLLLIADRNPFYLLSGVCMLFGCHLLNAALYDKAGDAGKLLLLLGVVNVYELLAVWLGVTLIRREVFKRDGRILLALEALFLVDVTFIAGVISTIDWRWGAWVNAGLLVLAGLKVWLILRALGVQQRGGMWLLFMAQTVVLLFVPTVFKSLASSRTGNLSPLVVYAGWWAAAVLPVLALALHRRPAALRPAAEVTMARVYLALPFVSLLVHLWSAGWVYSVEFQQAFVAPVLLGTAVALIAAEGQWLSRRAVRHAQAALVLLAVGLSVQFPRSLVVSFGEGGPEWALSPLRLVLVGAVAVSLLALWRYHWLACAYAAGVFLAAAVLGPTLPVMWGNLVAASYASAELARRLWPRTTLAWGVTAVGSSFLLLGMGALLSLRKARSLGPQEVSG